MADAVRTTTEILHDLVQRARPIVLGCVPNCGTDAIFIINPLRVSMEDSQYEPAPVVRTGLMQIPRAVLPSRRRTIVTLELRENHAMICADLSEIQPPKMLSAEEAMEQFGSIGAGRQVRGG